MHSLLTPPLAQEVIREHRAEAARIRRATRAQQGSPARRLRLGRRAGSPRPVAPRGRLHPRPAR
jgi:hypothetical protein